MNVRQIVAILAAALVAIFIVQNMATVEIRFIVWSMALPRAVVLLFILGVGFLLGWLWHAHTARTGKKEKDEPPTL